MAGSINYDEIRKARDNKKKRGFSLGSKKLNKLASKAAYRAHFAKNKRKSGGKERKQPKRWLSIFDPILGRHVKAN